MLSTRQKLGLCSAHYLIECDSCSIGNGGVGNKDLTQKLLEVLLESLVDTTDHQKDVNQIKPGLSPEPKMMEWRLPLLWTQRKKTHWKETIM